MAYLLHKTIMAMPVKFLQLMAATGVWCWHHCGQSRKPHHLSRSADTHHDGSTNCGHIPANVRASRFMQGSMFEQLTAEQLTASSQ